MSFKTLGEVCDKGDADVQTGPFGSQLHESDYVDEGVPVVMPKDIHDGRIDEASVARVSEHKASSLPRHFLRAGDIVLPRRGEISKRALITEDQSGYLCGTGCVRIRLSNGSVHPQFLYYYLDQPHIIQWIEQRAIGSTMLNLNTSIIKAIPLPPIAYDTQRRIASILSSYDDLIENNRKRIKLLERAARLLYKEWFVRLRFPGCEGVKVKDGVPEGWVKKRLDELAIVNERTLPSKYSGLIQYVDIASVTTGSIDKTEEYEFENAPGRARRLVADGDIIWSCVRPNRRSYAQVVDPLENLVVSTGFAVITPKEIGANYLYHAVTTDEFVGYLTTNAQGAAYPAVRAKDFEAAMVMRPSDKVMKEFEAVVDPMTRLRSVLTKEIAALTRARDLLLPRLMSGKFKV